MGLMDFVKNISKTVKEEAKLIKESEEIYNSKKQEVIDSFDTEMRSIADYIKENPDVRLNNLKAICPKIKFESYDDDDLDVEFCLMRDEEEQYASSKTFPISNFNYDDFLKWIVDEIINDYELGAFQIFTTKVKEHAYGDHFGVSDEKARYSYLEGTDEYEELEPKQINMYYFESGKVEDYLDFEEMPNEYKAFCNDLSKKLTKEKIEITHPLSKEFVAGYYDSIKKYCKS